MTEQVVVIVSCIPVYDKQNVVHAKRLGFADEMPWLQPYPESTVGRCTPCNGRIWIGPAQRKHIEAETEEGAKPTVVCHLCVMWWTVVLGVDIGLKALSKTETGFYFGEEQVRPKPPG